MLKKIICFVFLLFTGFEAVRAEDVKVKLNSADGSTSFQVRDSSDVVVSSITSLGAASFNSVTIDNASGYSITSSSGINMSAGTLNFPAGAVTDRTVTSGDLLITSSFTYIGAIVNKDETAEWADLDGMLATLNVTAVPAVIIVNGSAKFARKDTGWANHRLAIEIDGTVVALNSFETGQNDVLTVYHAVAVTGAARITSTGNKVVKLKFANWGNCDISQRSMTCFWVGTP